ncbi:MAG: flagellar motor switch protein FliG [Candidatus Hydrogenedentes bacterium]|nr:flagellar motor switch protein FliG [Candidatus Hydrogenedentota bacterium]
MTGRRKAAILLTCLGPEVAKHVMGSLTDDEVDQITLDISGLGVVDADLKASVLDEFLQMAVAKRFVAQGGIDMAKDMLEKAFGAERAFEVLNRLQSSLQEVPFQFLKKADAGQIASFIQDEHPQTVALILAHMNPPTAAIILTSMPQAVQTDVIMRIANMDRTAPEIVREVERVLERKLSSVFSQGFTFAGGVKDVAEILNRVERTTEKTIMADLEERDPELADEIGRLMFTFDDLVYVDDSGIQKALREIESKDLALALKASSEEVGNKVFKNMSERAREMIREEIQFMGPVRLRNVEEAQQKIVAIIRRLEESGELIVQGRGGGAADEILV